jgi:hypothetical protein
MKAQDSAKPFGSVIGNALLPLKLGRGQIPVLVHYNACITGVSTIPLEMLTTLEVTAVRRALRQMPDAPLLNRGPGKHAAELDALFADTRFGPDDAVSHAQRDQSGGLQRRLYDAGAEVNRAIKRNVLRCARPLLPQRGSYFSAAKDGG